MLEYVAVKAVLNALSVNVNHIWGEQASLGEVGVAAP